MFISAKFLAAKYGVDLKIAQFFVDREPPADNLYWQRKLLYLRPSAGYLFIPLIIDLLFRLGIERDKLLSENFVSGMEQIGHISALEESKEISIEEAIQKCEEVIETKVTNKVWLTQVINYFRCNQETVFTSFTTPFKSLHRGDIFLFSLSALQFSYNIFAKIAEQWFSLISTLLLLDDAEDIESDREAGDENAFLESGLNAEGLERIAELIKENIRKLSTVNPIMSEELSGQCERAFNELNFRKLLNLSV